jgi:divalent metal cation (Fe/Co/Zn/Cd) transporter
VPQRDNWQNLLVAFFLLGVAILLGIALFSSYATNAPGVPSIKGAGVWIMLASLAVALIILWSGRRD